MPSTPTPPTPEPTPVISGVEVDTAQAVWREAQNDWYVQYNAAAETQSVQFVVRGSDLDYLEPLTVQGGQNVEITGISEWSDYGDMKRCSFNLGVTAGQNGGATLEISDVRITMSVTAPAVAPSINDFMLQSNALTNVGAYWQGEGLTIDLAEARNFERVNGSFSVNGSDLGGITARPSVFIANSARVPYASTVVQGEIQTVSAGEAQGFSIAIPDEKFSTAAIGDFFCIGVDLYYPSGDVLTYGVYRYLVIDQ